MKKQLTFKVVIATTFLAVSVMQVQAQEVSFRPTHDRVDTLREDMLNITAKSHMIPMMPSASTAAIEDAQWRIDNVSDEQLFEIYKSVGPYVHQLSNLLDQYEADLVELDRIIFEKSTSPPFPEAAYPTGDLKATYGGLFDPELVWQSGGSGMSAVNFLFSVACTKAGQPQTDRVLYQLRFNAKQAILVAELLKDVLGRLCDQEFNIAGVGGDLSLACIVSDLIYHAARPLDEFPEICDDNIDSAEIEGSYERLGHLHDDLGTMQAKIDDIDGDLTAHASALSTHDTNIFNALNGSLTAVTSSLDATETAILNSLSTHHTDIESILNQNNEFFLRSFIERALRREIGNGHSTPSSVNYRIASLYLPEAYGGNLGEVREVVAAAIDAVIASGEDVDGAAAILSQGDAASSDGHFKEAWDFYADAYAEAVMCRKSKKGCR
jgi:hypothetical protein